MSYRLELEGSARRNLNRLPAKVADVALTFCEGPLLDNPRRVGKPLVGDFVGLWAARRGTYRVLYRIDEPAQVVRVERIDHRANVYRPR